jgi:hypothetical protein
MGMSVGGLLASGTVPFRTLPIPKSALSVRHTRSIMRRGSLYFWRLCVNRNERSPPPAPCLSLIPSLVRIRQMHETLFDVPKIFLLPLQQRDIDGMPVCGQRKYVRGLLRKLLKIDEAQPLLRGPIPVTMRILISNLPTPIHVSILSDPQLG